MNIQKIKREQERQVRRALRNLRNKAPSVYRDLMLTLPPQAKAGIGAIDWSDVGKNLVDAYVDTTQYKAISSEDRKAADLEIKKLQEQNSAAAAKIKLVKERNRMVNIGGKVKMAGESVIDQFMAKPWALPALGVLGFALYRSISARRSGRRG